MKGEDPRVVAMRRVTQLPDLNDRLRAGFFTQYGREASPDYWTRHADLWAAVGTEEADEIALACRRHAWLLADIAAERAWVALTQWERAA